ncbi:MAG: undecaprenyldiphospho-muramoylpentapeptide beta-N-acetylglucosaminyltransferase [Oscillospiraceae bacterium]|nr:undecaprenyldiphospho-muramoylpentapeptide beta-N-acetylglucosaminyltransferase [Oscillospiraceae bacterium]
MNVIFTCGGTAGHVNPALALAGLLKEREENVRILFVGANRGLERELVTRAGYDFRAVNISSFHRSLRPRELRHNAISVFNLLRAPMEARAVLRDFTPDVIVGTGGYASYPMLRGGAKAGIPTLVHESNAVPGLTTRLVEPYCKRIMVGFEDCRAYYKKPEKVVVTGTPVRGDFFKLTREEAKHALGINDGRPLIVSFWGSLGASVMNRRMAEFIALEAKHEPFHHVHAAGSICCAHMGDWLRECGVAQNALSRIDVREYIHNMAVLMRAADLVICRAGASTIAELTALGVPALIVPSPNVTNNHQEKNARILEAHGAACVLTEDACDGKRLFEAACAILHDDARRDSMSRAMASLGTRDAAERILDTVFSLLR